MISGIGGANYSCRYRLQPLPLIIGPITSITDVSVQLYLSWITTVKLLWKLKF